LLGRYNLDWVLGFAAEEVESDLLYIWLHKFVELVFLREADTQGMLPAIPSSIRHLQSKSRILDSVERAMCVRELLTYSSVVLIHVPPGQDGAVTYELVYSSQMCKWGMPLPGCPNCGNHHVIAFSEHRGHRRGKDGDFVIVRCRGCGWRTAGTGPCRPDAIVPVGRNPQETHYFWKPLDLESPWVGHQWRPKGVARVRTVGP
jgi:hypothetical protein